MKGTPHEAYLRSRKFLQSWLLLVFVISPQSILSNFHPSNDTIVAGALYPTLDTI